MAIDSPGWVTILNTTIPKFMRNVEVNILRSRILLAMLEQKGRITYSNSGTKFDKKIEYKRAPMSTFTDGDVISFARVDRHKTMQLPNDRSYIIPEMMSEIEKLQNSGDEAIVKLWDSKAKTLADDLREGFADQLYIDGNATGNTRKIQGIETFLGATTTAMSPGFVKPTDTYGDLSTAPQAYGGNWSNGTWPAGSGDAQYDFFSPILVDTISPVANAYPGISTLEWSNTCNQALRKVITKTRKSKSVEGKIDLILLEDTMFEQFKNAQDNRTQIRVERGQNLQMLALGFDMLEFDGVAIASEFGMPVNTGYCFNTMKMELLSMYPELFHSVGPFFDERTQCYNWLVSFVGNAMFNPKFFGKLYPYNQA